MGLHGAKDIELRFTRYVEELVSVIGHADRAGPLRDYCTGLVMPGERKSVEPMAAITAPGRTAAQHQSLLHFVGQGAWSDDAVLTKVRETGIAAVGASRTDRGLDHRRHRPSQEGAALGWGVAPILRPAWQAGELPGGGVAVARQSPCEPAGGVSAVFAEGLGRGCGIAARKAGVPEEIAFKTKPEIALEQIRWACEVGLPGNMALMDAGYGHDCQAARGHH